MLLRWLPCTVALVLLGGCLRPVREQTDLTICDLSAHSVDPLPPATGPGGDLITVDHREAEAQAGTAGGGQKSGGAAGGKMSSGSRTEPVLPPAGQPLSGAEQGPKPRATLSDRLQIPLGLPGARAAPLRMPDDPVERERYLRQLYTNLPPLGANPLPRLGPEGHPLNLEDLQRLALANSPLLRQPAADVQAVRGAAIQAGAYPNPNVGYQADTAGTAGTAGFQGFFIEQTIRTGGKLKLAQAAALMDVMNAETALRRAESDLATSIRGGYFAVLVARENVRVTEALTQLTDEAFRIQVEQARVVAAPYEPMQLRALAYQARGALLTARNRHVSAWKQLAAAVGLPGLPPTELAGRVDMPVPVFDYDRALGHVLRNHTDVRMAESTLQRARYALRLAQVTPVPDVSMHLAVEKDYTTPPFSIVSSVQLGVPVPVWDHNQGNIIQAQGQLLRAAEEPHRVRDDLTTRLADAFERYQTNRVLVELYREHILPDQVRAYQGVRARHNVEPDIVGFGDVVTAQQTLAGVVTTYVSTLGAMWTGVVDVANLLQTNDLFQVGALALPTACVAPVPDVAQLLSLPCCHPCNPLPDRALKETPDATWPEPMPGMEIPRSAKPANHGQSNRAARTAPLRIGFLAGPE